MIERVAHGGILCGDVLLVWHFRACCLLHVLGTSHQLLDVVSGASDGQQAHGGEHGEAPAHVVGDDKALVAFLVSTGACRAFLGVGHGHDDIFGLFLTHLSLALLFQQAEGEGGLGGSAALGYVDNAELLTLQVFGKFRQVVLADVVASEKNGGVLAVVHQPGERIAHGLNHGARSQVAAAYACHYHRLAFLAQRVGHGLDFVQELRSDARGEMQPPQEVITWACAVLQCQLSRFHLGLQGLHRSLAEELLSLRDV